jgi:hypothetical protein
VQELEQTEGLMSQPKGVLSTSVQDNSTGNCVHGVANRVRILRKENSILREEATRLARQIDMLRRSSFEAGEPMRSQKKNSPLFLLNA